MITAILLLAAQASVPAGPADCKASGKDEMPTYLSGRRSRIPDKLCLTQAEWDKMAAANQDDWTSSRNQRSAGRAGTITNSLEGTITTIQVPHQNGPGPNRPH